MKTVRAICYVLSIFITLPIKFYLTHFLLVATHADRLLFFLFWVDVFATVPIYVMLRVAEEAASKAEKEAAKK